MTIYDIIAAELTLVMLSCFNFSYMFLFLIHVSISHTCFYFSYMFLCLIHLEYKIEIFYHQNIRRRIFYQFQVFYLIVNLFENVYYINDFADKVIFWKHSHTIWNCQLRNYDLCIFHDLHQNSGNLLNFPVFYNYCYSRGMYIQDIRNIPRT